MHVDINVPHTMCRNDTHRPFYTYTFKSVAHDMNALGLKL